MLNCSGSAVQVAALPTKWQPVGPESCWGFSVSDACSPVTLGAVTCLWNGWCRTVLLRAVTSAQPMPAACQSFLLQPSTFAFSGCEGAKRQRLCRPSGNPVGVNLAGVSLFRMRADRWRWGLLGFSCFGCVLAVARRCVRPSCRQIPPLAPQAKPLWFCFRSRHTSLPYPLSCWACFSIRLLVFALYSSRRFRWLDLRATAGASMGERTHDVAMSNTKLLAAMCVSATKAAIGFKLPIWGRRHGR